MSQPKTLEAKVIYRSNHSQLAMISIMKYGGIWDRLGIEVSRMDLERRALPAEDQLLDGKCNMIFGCHITPHWRVASGVPMICMAQTVNTSQDMLVSTKPLAGLNDLKDRVLAEQDFCDEEGHLTSHVRGTYELYLRDAGLSSDQLDVKRVESGDKNAAPPRRQGGRDLCQRLPGESLRAPRTPHPTVTPLSHGQLDHTHQFGSVGAR